MNKKALKAALLAASMGVSANASAGFFQDVGNWINDNIVDPVKTNVIDPITGAINDAQGYINLIQEAAGQVGYTGTVGNQAYYTPAKLAGRSGELKVVTFNVKGFPEVLNGISDAQASQLARESLNGKGYDIVGLQENWVRNYAIMSALSTTDFPFRSDHFQGTAISFGDGLSTISKYPMIGRQHHVDYTKCSGTYQEFFSGATTSPDCETEKGFTWSEVQIAKDFVIHVYNTHMDANGGSKEGPGGQLEQLQNFIASWSAGKPVIVMGDFNLWIDDGQHAPGPNQSALGKFATDLGLTWACVAAGDNTNRPNDKCAGVDHIAYRGNSQFSFTTISEGFVDQHISDHDPHGVTLRWTNNAYSESPEEQTAVRIALATAHNGYIWAEGGTDVRQSFPADAQVGETFTMALDTAVASNPRCIQSGDKVTIRTGNGRYFMAHPSGVLDAQAHRVGGWEKFTLINHSDAHGCLRQGQSISLRTAHNTYVVADGNRADMNGNQTSIGAWEKFGVEFPGYYYTQIPGVMKQVSTGADGDTWAVGGGGEVYRLYDGRWFHLPGILSQISVADKNTIWGVAPTGQAYKWNDATGNWHLMPGGGFKWISAGNDGEVWGVTINDDIYRFHTGAWHQVGGKLKQISVGNTHNIWGVNANNQAFRWQWGYGWVHVPGNVEFVSAAADGSVWIKCGGCNNIQYRVNHYPYWRLANYPNRFGSIQSFSHAGGKYFWAVNTNGHIFNYGGNQF